MKAKLYKVLDQYHLYDGDKAIATTIVGNPMLLPNLSKQNCDELFGVVDVEKLGDEHALEIYTKNEDDIVFYENRQRNFIEGFHKAMELNKDKVFGVKEVVELCKILLSNPFEKCGKTYQELTDNYIQSLQQPTEIEVEICCYIGNGDK